MWDRAFIHIPLTRADSVGRNGTPPSGRAEAADQAMNSSACLNAGGLSPELYQAAREAAHRAGMSVEDWLRSTFGDSAVASMRQQGSGPLGARLGELSQRFGQAAEAEPAPLSVRGARLSDTVAKLNARLDQMTASHPGAPAPQAAMTAPPPAPKATAPERDIDGVIAEIAARQRALDRSEERRVGKE